MKKIDQLTPSQKAAALMIAVGPEVASDIFKNLDEKTVTKITAEIAKIESLSPSDRDDLIGEFICDIKANRAMTFGGEDIAKKILFDSVGIEKANRIFSKVESAMADEKFTFLNDADPDVIKDIISKEHPQIIAIVLTRINRSKAAEVLKILDRDCAKAVALKIAKMQAHSPEALLSVSKTIKMRYDQAMSKQADMQSVPGINHLASILNHIDSSAEKRIVSHLETIIPQKAMELREKIYSFESILDLTNREIRILIDEISDDSLIALSLKGAGDELRFKIFRNMSNTRATNVINEMERFGAVRLSEINEARHYIVSITKRLNEEGVIILRKGDEQMIE